MDIKRYRSCGSEYQFINRLMTGFGTVPADNEVIDDLADTAEFFDGLADVHVITVDVDHAFQAHTVGQSSDDKRRNVESFR